MLNEITTYLLIMIIDSYSYCLKQSICM